MFLGTAEPEFRSIIDEHSKGWDVDDVYVACSGNFTLERTLEGSRFALHSNDVSVYSCALGWWLCGQHVPHALKESTPDDLRWLEEYLDGGVGTIATLMLCTRFLASAGKPDHIYHSRMVKAYREQFSKLHASTTAKLAKVGLRLTSFWAMDAREYLAEVVPIDAAVASFPPFFAGGYETMFAPLDKVFDWPKPEYPELDDAGIGDMIAMLMARKHWIVGSNHRWPALSEHLRAMVQTGPRRMPWYVYSSNTGARVVRPQQAITPVAQRRLNEGDEIGGRMAIASLTMGQFNALRSQYLDPRIAPAGPQVACGVLVDGKVVGAFGFTRDQWNGEAMYLLSDFAVAPTDYPRLSKLIVMAATSREAQILAAQHQPAGHVDLDDRVLGQPGLDEVPRRDDPAQAD